jgi:hypothetical protein
MSLPIIYAAAKVELSDEHHLGRLLILIMSAGGKNKKSIAGIMKLAKLDFLLRYPNCLERVLRAQGLNQEEAQVKPFEKNSIEAKMIRFKYGPWDDRYRRWIGLLVGKGLATTYLTGRTVYVGLTDKGRDVAQTFKRLDEFHLVVRAVGNLSASKLKDFIYQTFPELLTMEWGEEITL